MDCNSCGEQMISKTIVWKDPDRPPVQHTNFVCEFCGNSVYKRYELISEYDTNSSEINPFGIFQVLL